MILLAAHVVAAAGGFLGKKYRLPAGLMIGAMLGVVLMNLLSGYAAPYPRDLRVVVQICSGIVIGSRFTRKDVHELRQVLFSTLLMVIGLLGVNLLFAQIIYRVSPLSAVTALFASAPGGMSDLSIIAADFGADTAQVTLLQVVRFVFVLSFFPPLVRRRAKAAHSAPETAAAPPQAAIQPGIGEEHPVEDAARNPKKMLTDTLIAAACATLGGYTLRGMGVPAGAVIGSIFATIFLSLCFRTLTLPKGLRMMVQISCGCYVGCQVTRASISAMGSLLFPMLLVLIEVFVLAFGLSWVVHRLTGLDRDTALFSCIPGGLAEMVLLADDLQLDTPKIVVAQTCRVIAVICLMPLLVRLIIH